MTPRQLRRYRTRIERMSQVQFARLLRIHSEQVYEYEKGLAPIPNRITRMVAALEHPGDIPGRYKEARALKAGIAGRWRALRPNSWVLRG